MYSEMPKYPIRLYITPSGLTGLDGGIDPVSAECPQPVHSDERDRIRDSLKVFTRNWMGQKPHGHHWHEGHPDVKAAINDIIIRMIGITQRPKKLRCSAEMRKRANQWNGALHTLLLKVKTGGKGYGGRTVVGSDFSWTFYRGPRYTIRSTSNPKVKAAMDAWAAGKRGKKEKAISDAPPGSIVVDGNVYPSSAAATAATVSGVHPPPAVQGALSTAPTVTGRGGPRLTTPVVGGVDEDGFPLPVVGFGVASSIGLPDTVVGIPTDYVLLGGGAYAAFKYLKKR